jgi:hypothetical protein
MCKYYISELNHTCYINLCSCHLWLSWKTLNVSHWEDKVLQINYIWEQCWETCVSFIINQAVSTYSLKLILHPHMWLKLTKYPNHRRQPNYQYPVKSYPRQWQKNLSTTNYTLDKQFTQSSDQVLSVKQTLQLEIKWLVKPMLRFGNK